MLNMEQIELSKSRTQSNEKLPYFNLHNTSLIIKKKKDSVHNKNKISDKENHSRSFPMLL